MAELTPDHRAMRRGERKGGGDLCVLPEGCAATHVEAHMDLNNVGGTPGGLRTFVLGSIMAIAGGYLLFHQVQVTGGYWGWMGYGGAGHSFGITLLPLLF